MRISPIENRWVEIRCVASPFRGIERGAFSIWIGEISSMLLELYVSINSTCAHIHDESAVGLFAHLCFPPRASSAIKRRSKCNFQNIFARFEGFLEPFKACHILQINRPNLNPPTYILHLEQRESSILNFHPIKILFTL